MRDMEAKVKDQEEELDEQAGTIQMLEQVRLIQHIKGKLHPKMESSVCPNEDSGAADS